VSVSTTKLETKNLENNNNAGKLKKNFELSTYCANNINSRAVALA